MCLSNICLIPSFKKWRKACLMWDRRVDSSDKIVKYTTNCFTGLFDELFTASIENECHKSSVKQLKDCYLPKDLYSYLQYGFKRDSGLKERIKESYFLYSDTVRNLQINQTSRCTNTEVQLLNRWHLFKLPRQVLVFSLCLSGLLWVIINFNLLNVCDE